MKKTISKILAITSLTLLSSTAWAGGVVPEMDGSTAAIALGLAVGAVALMNERRNKK